MQSSFAVVSGSLRAQRSRASTRVSVAGAMLAVAIVTSGCARTADVLAERESGQIGAAVELVPIQFGMCARTSVGKVACWRAGYPETVTVVGELGPAARLVSAGSQGYLCVVDDGGHLACKDVGEETSLTPVQTAGPVRDASVGFWGGCALSGLTSMQCWGNAATGLLDSIERVSVDLIPALEHLETKSLPGPAVQLAYNELHGCAVLADGRVFCHGENGHGEVNGLPVKPVPSPQVIVAPVELAGITDATRVAVTASGTCVLHKGRTITCVGEASTTGFGFEPQSATRGKHEIQGVTAIASSRWSTCALTEDGETYCWGLGQCGAINDVEGVCGAEIEDAPTPILVSGFPAAKALGIDDGQLCIIDFDDDVWCRGFRWDYDVGTAVAEPVPHRVRL